MSDWRDPQFDKEKLRLMRAAWGDRLPDYAHYFLPEGINLRAANWTLQDEVFFGGVAPSFGGREVHWRSGFTGSLLLNLSRVPGIQDFRLLRIRNPKVFPPARIEMDGKSCPLIQFGKSDDFEKIGADGATPLCVNFIKLWGWQD